MPLTKQEVLFRPMTAGDIPDLVAIEITWQGSRWTRSMFERELNLHMSVSGVAELSGEPVGFGILWAVTDTAQLLEFAVAEKFRRYGVGTSLMEYLMETARLRACVKMELEMREGNFPAQSFYEKMGFLVTGRRRRFYDMGQGKMSDAILMERPL